jgi:hypothetical protein
MENAGNNKMPKNAVFECEDCHFKCFKKSNWITHLKTIKHIHRVNGNLKENAEIKKCQENTCTCGKKYTTLSGLWKHKKKCESQICTDINNNETTTQKSESTEKQDIYELVKFLMKENSELKTMMMEQQSLVLEIAKNGTHNTTHTNSHNKTFNLQIFLNETCKDAMNIMDFVDQIVLNLNDLEETGRLGFAEGISKMILKRLKNLDITQRPIHCSDLKRETLYIKDENKWEKEEETKPKLTKAVKEISAKNIRQIKDWQKKHPDYNDPESKTSDKYMNMLMNVMAGGTEEEMQDNYEKVVKNIVKETTIAKENFLV